MIKLLFEVILFILRLLNGLTFGFLDNFTIIYGIFSVTTAIVVFVVAKRFRLYEYNLSLWKKFLLVTSLFLNCLCSFWMWILGIIIFACVILSMQFNFEKNEENVGLKKRIKLILKNWLEDEDDGNITKEVKKSPSKNKSADNENYSYGGKATFSTKDWQKVDF